MVSISKKILNGIGSLNLGQKKNVLPENCRSDKPLSIFCLIARGQVTVKEREINICVIIIITKNSYLSVAGLLRVAAKSGVADG